MMELISKAFDLLIPTMALGWDKLVALLNSNFMAALAGAGLGAYAADRIATRRERSKKISTALESTNSAIALSGLISNQALIMKGQHILDLHRNFVLEEVRYNEIKRRHDAGEVIGPGERVIVTNLVQLPELHVPIDALTALVFDKVSAGARHIGLLLAVQNAIRDLNLFIQRRNQLCAQFREISPEIRAPLYLGLPIPQGRDETYPHCIFNIYQSTNDLAFFAAHLATDLQQHGKRLSERYAKAFRTSPPHVNEMKFDTPRAKELMPPEVAYSDYLSMFKQVEAKKPDGLLRRIKNQISGIFGQ